MKTLLLAFLPSLLCATSSLELKSATPTGLVFILRTDQGGSCTMKLTDTYIPGVYDFTTGYLPVADVNTTLFPGRDSCSRAWNVDLGSYKELSFGFHATAISASDNRRYSLAQQADTRLYLQVAIGSDIATYLGASTTNPPNGNTYQMARFDRLNPGQYHYPTMKWNDRTATYIDPITGIRTKRITGPVEISPITNSYAFVNPLTGGSGWSVTGLSATYNSTSQSKLYLRGVAVTGAYGSGYQQNYYPSFSQLVVTLGGTLTSVNVCLTANGVTCAGKTNTITSTGSAQTIGDTVPINEYWRNSTATPLLIGDQKQLTGNVTVDVDKITVHRTSGGLFNSNWVAGSIITIAGTDCAIATFTDENTVTLSSNTCTVAGTGVAYTANNFGFLLWAATNTSGTITVASPTWNLGTAEIVGAYDGGGNSMCQQVQYSGGYLCGLASHHLIWVGPDGSANPLGYAYIAPGSGGLNTGTGASCNGAGDYSGWAFDPVVAGKFWCIGNNPAGDQVMFSMTYTGGTAAVTYDTTGPTQNLTATIGDVSATSITAQVEALNSSMTASASICVNAWKQVMIGQNDIILLCNNQDAQGNWIAVYSTTSHSIIAATQTWGGTGAKSHGGVHDIQISTDGYMHISVNNSNQISQSTTASAMTSSYSACPTNTVDPSVNGLTQCTAITVNSNTPSPSWFSDPWIAGNYGVVYSNGSRDGEMVRILTMSGLNWVVQRDVMHAFTAGLMGSNTNHTGSLAIQTFPGNAGSQEMFWDYAADPSGTDVADAKMFNGRSFSRDRDSSDCHELFEPLMSFMPCLGGMGQSVSGFGNNLTAIRYGAYPASFTANLIGLNIDPPFAGSTYFPSSGNYLEAHPSGGVITSTASTLEKSIVTDFAPFLGEPAIATSGTVSKVASTTYLYKLAASATTTFSFKLLPTLVTTGGIPLVDVSPAVIADTTGDQYKFCYVIIAGDCHASSLVGEIYANVPFATVPYSYNARVTDGSNLTRDISITQITHRHHGGRQEGSSVDSRYGETQRFLVSGFSQYKSEPYFGWNGSAEPAGKNLLWETNYLDGVRPEWMIAAVPPQPPSDSVQRNGFVNISVQLPSVIGANKVRARFGYAENNLNAAFPGYCTPRQVVCTTSGTPFAWADEAQSVQDCAGGCTVKIPAIAGRTLYYVIDRSPDGVAWTAGTASAVGVN